MVVRRSPKPLTGVRSPLPLLIKDLDFQGPFLLLYMFSFSYRKSDFLFNHIFSYALFPLLIAFLVAFYFLFNRIFSCVFYPRSAKFYKILQLWTSRRLNSHGFRHLASFFLIFQFWHAGAPDHKPDLCGERHPFLVFFFFGMPGHPIISWIYTASGILFWFFSFLACQSTRS